MEEKTPLKKIILYFFATYLFSWLFWVPSAIMFKNTDSIGKLIQSPVFIALQTLGAAGPSIIALIVLKLEKKTSEIKAIFDRYKRWRFGKKGYFFSVLFFPLISLLALILHVLLIAPISENHPLMELYAELGFASLLVIPLIFVGQLFSSPLLEEFGWRGYAQPILQERFSVLVSSTIIGLVWGLWHLPLALAYNFSLPVQLIMFISVSIWIGYIYNSTKGSMLAVLLFHASLNVGLNMIAPKQDSLVLALIIVLATILAIYFTPQRFHLS